MQNLNYQNAQTQQGFHFGHVGLVLSVAVLLLGISWMKNPQLFSVFSRQQNAAQAANTDVPHYYAYVPPAGDQQPEVLGASTQPQGPMIINDDGTVSPVDAGQVLGASTQGVDLSLDDIKVSTVPDSDQAAQKYFSDAQAAESGAINQADFASALTSGDQEQINAQAQNLIAINAALQKLTVPQSLVKLQKLKIIQYNSAIALLQNFTQADQNPDLVNQDMQEFIKSQQDLDSENAVVAQKYPAQDPDASSYVDDSGNLLSTQAAAPAPAVDNSQPDLSNLDSSNDGQ